MSSKQPRGIQQLPHASHLLVSNTMLFFQMAIKRAPILKLMRATTALRFPAEIPHVERKHLPFRRPRPRPPSLDKPPGVAPKLGLVLGSSEPPVRETEFRRPAPVRTLPGVGVGDLESVIVLVQSAPLPEDRKGLPMRSLGTDRPFRADAENQVDGRPGPEPADNLLDK